MTYYYFVSGQHNIDQYHKTGKLDLLTVIILPEDQLRFLSGTILKITEDEYVKAVRETDTDVKRTN